MVDQQHDVLRLQPHMIPSVRAKFEAAVNQVNAALVGLNQGGYLPRPWLGDEISSAVAEHYTTRALDGPNSSYRLLVTYRDELRRIHDTLQQMEENYRRNEGQDPTRWGRQA